MNTLYDLEEVIQFAQKNDNIISKSLIRDMLISQYKDITYEEISIICEELTNNHNLQIEYEESEDYIANGYERITDVIPSDVNIIQRPLNVSNLLSRLENDEIDLYPDFQRNENLWSPVKQCQLIESLMLRIPLPAFYFNAQDDNKWIVIDGLQRLSAFRNYLLEDRKFEGLQFLKDFNGLSFKDLPRQYNRRIIESGIIAYTVESGTPDSVVYNIFQRINTGGVTLLPQEIRNALYPGKATRLTSELAKSKNFLDATQMAIHSERMQDREYINRYLAFTELDVSDCYKGNIDLFLRLALKTVNSFSDEKILEIKKNFEDVMKTCYRVFGNYTFRKFNDNRRGAINKALFECVSSSVKKMDHNQRKQLIDKRTKVLKVFKQSFENDEFNLLLKAGDEYTVIKRLNVIDKELRNFL